MTHELVLRCNNYAGSPSEERCRTLEEYVRSHLQTMCDLKKVELVENEWETNLITPELVVQYSGIDDKEIVEKLDDLLIDIGISAIKAVVSDVITRGVEGALGGGALGLLGGSKNSGAALAAALIGGLIGGAIGQSIKKTVPLLVAYKQGGQWTIDEIAQSR